VSQLVPAHFVLQGSGRTGPDLRDDDGAERPDPSSVCKNKSAAAAVISLNQWLVREGWALTFEPYAKKRFVIDEANARDNRRRFWKGCFSSPQHYRRWEKTNAVLLGLVSGEAATAFTDY
jgi:hypothetical protein